MRIASVGHAVFAATMIAVGALGLIRGDFAAIWQPVPAGLPGREALAVLCALVALATGTGLLWRRTAAIAARVLLGYLLLWMLLFKASGILRAPTTEVAYESCGETAVIVAAAWVLYAWFAGARDRRWLSFATGDSGVRLACMLYGLALVAFGLSHVAYAGETAALVPTWLPVPLVWTYFFGATYLAAGVAMLVGALARFCRRAGRRADGLVHRAGLGAGRGDGPERLAMERVRRVRGADGRSLGDGGCLPRFAVMRCVPAQAQRIAAFSSRPCARARSTPTGTCGIRATSAARSSRLRAAPVRRARCSGSRAGRPGRRA